MKVNFKRGLVGLAGVLSCALAAAGAADSDATMQARLQVAKYAGETTLANFPVLVRISPQNIEGFDYALCRADGSDIRFVDGSGTAIGFEVEQWNPGGESLVWVNLPTLSAGTTFFMQWGGSAVSHESSDAWNANYAGVWHMGEQNGICANSTRHGAALNATPKGNVENSARYNGPDAPVGGARTTATSAANGYLSVANYDSLALGDTFTVSGWMRMTAATGCARVFSRKTTYTSGDGWECEMGSGVYDKCSSRGASVTSVAATFATSAENNWVHVALVYDGTTLTVFGDGEQLASGTIAKATDNGQPLSFGCDSDGNEAYVRGAFDECRLMDGAASADWVKAEYDSIVDRAFISYGSAEWLTDDPALAVGTPVVLAAGDNNVSFQLAVSGIGEGATSATLSLVYGTAADEMTEERTVAELTERGFTAAVLGRLYPDQTYYVKAVARNNLGDVAESKVITVTTGQSADVFAQPGLKQTYFTSANAVWTKDYSELPDGTDWKHYTDADRICRRELGVIAAYLGGNPGTTKYVSEVWGDDVYWPANGGQWAYWGEMYLDASRTYRFRMKIDDNERVVIADAKTGKEEVLLEDKASGSGLVTSGDYKPSATGWHRIEVRLSDGTGGAGGYDKTDNYKNTTNMGYSDDAGFSWKLLLDPGDGSLLRTIDRRLVDAFEVIRDGALAGIKLTFEAAETDRELHIVWGKVHGGNAPADWAHDETVATVAAGETTVTFDPPAAWGEDACIVMRYYFAGGTPNWSNSLYWRVYGEPVKSVTVTGEPEEWAAPNPGYGIFRDLKAGQPCTFTCPSATTNDEEGVVYVCDGWRHTLADGTEATGTDCSLTFTYAEETACSTVTWLFHRQYKVTTSVVGDGRIETESAWFDEGVDAAFTAVPSAGQAFWRWEGTAIASGRQRYTASIEVPVDKAKTLTARFYDPSLTPRKTLYVTPSGAGTKDGSSWENASASLSTAYAALSEWPTGGEIWMAKGRYNCDTAFTMAPNIIIRGGFAGTETSAEETDPKANPTIIGYSALNKGTDTWGHGADTAMWTGEDLMTLVEPTCADNEAVFDFTYSGIARAVLDNTDGADVGESGCYGLWFHGYYSHVLKTTSPNAKPFVFKNCRFSACGWFQHNTDKVINAVDASVEIENCEFIGCANTVFLSTTSVDSPATTNVVRNCRFFTCDYNWNCSPCCSGVSAVNNAKLTLQGTSFDKCRNSSQNFDQHAGALFLNTVQNAQVEDCSFKRSVTTANTRGAAVVIAPLTNIFTVTFNRCHFEGNTYSGGGRDAHNCVGAAIGGVGTGWLYVNDSSFVGNVVTNAAYANPCGSCVGLTGTWKGAFSNCTFEDNVAFGETAARRDRYTITTAWGSARYFTFANCVFNENRNGYLDDGGAYVPTYEFREANGWNENQVYALVNSIFANSDAAYLPWGTNLLGETHFSFADCVTTADTIYGAGKPTGFRAGLLAVNADPTLKAELDSNGFAIARGIEEDSPFRRAGLPVYRATDGDLYIYDAKYNVEKPWRLGRSPDKVYTEEEGAELGLVRSGEPVFDFRGQPRSRFRTALGPVDFGRPGMMLLVR